MLYLNVVQQKNRFKLNVNYVQHDGGTDQGMRLKFSNHKILKGIANIDIMDKQEVD